jgi:hypothetical protein
MAAFDPATAPYADAATTPLAQQSFAQVNKNLDLNSIDLSENPRQYNREIAGIRPDAHKPVPFQAVGFSEQNAENEIHKGQQQRAWDNNYADWAKGRGPGTGPSNTPGGDFYDMGVEGRSKQHDPNVAAGDEPSMQQALAITADYAHKNQGFTDPEYLNGKATEALAQLSKEGVNVKGASPQLLHMYITGDKLSQAYAFMRLSGVMDESGAMKRLPSVHTAGGGQ